MPDDLEIGAEIVRSISVIYRRWTTAFNESLAPLGQTKLRWRALAEIHGSEDGVSQKRLAESLGADEPTVGRIVTALEQQDLVVRRSQASDRRVKVVQVTPRGAEMVRLGGAINGRICAHAVVGVSSDELAVANRVLRQLSERLTELDLLAEPLDDGGDDPSLLSSARAQTAQKTDGFAKKSRAAAGCDA